MAAKARQRENSPCPFSKLKARWSIRVQEGWSLTAGPLARESLRESMHVCLCLCGLRGMDRHMVGQTSRV